MLEPSEPLAFVRVSVLPFVPAFLLRLAVLELAFIEVAVFVGFATDPVSGTLLPLAFVEAVPVVFEDAGAVAKAGEGLAEVDRL